MLCYQKLEDGTWLTAAGKTLCPIPDGDICFAVQWDRSQASYRLITHGSRDQVLLRVERTNATVQNEPDNSPYEIISSSEKGWDLDEVNRCLRIRGHLNTLLCTPVAKES